MEMCKAAPPGEPGPDDCMLGMLAFILLFHQAWVLTACPVGS